MDGGHRTDEKLTMTIAESARASAISRGLAYDLARRDKLPVKIIRLGKRLVLNRRAVLDLLSGKEDEKEGFTDSTTGDKQETK